MSLKDWIFAAWLYHDLFDDEPEDEDEYDDEEDEYDDEEDEY